MNRARGANIDIYKEIAERLRNYCENENLTMSQFVNECVNERLDIIEREMLMAKTKEELIDDLIGQLVDKSKEELVDLLLTMPNAKQNKEELE